MKVFEKIPDYIVKYIIAGLVIFVVILSAFFIKDLFSYKFSLPHEKFFYLKCETYENSSIVYIITKENVKYIKVFDLENNLLHFRENLNKDSEYAIKIKKIENEPVLIEYSIDNSVRTAYVKCEKSKKEKSLISRLLGI